MRLLKTVLCITLVLKCAYGADSEPPNIVLLFVDDLGWTDVGFRSDKFESPNIDQLARDGVSFEQTYVASPTCSPSRATLLTGKHPARLRLVRHIPTSAKNPSFDKFGRAKDEFNLWPSDPAQFPCRNWLPLEHVTYAEALEQFGYYSLFVGKWHLGHEEFHPIHQGFNKQIGTTNWGHPKSYNPPFFINSPPLLELGFGQLEPAEEQRRYLTDRLTDETVSFIEGYRRDQPFMISLWYYNVHAPHVGRTDLLQHFEGRGLEGRELHYAAMIKAVDDSVGRIRRALQESGKSDETVIIFASDQGSWFENPPFRGSKRVDTLGEGGARVPLFVYWPGVTQAGTKSNEVVQTTDIFPTLVEVAGGEPDEFDDLDGVSLAQTLHDGSRVNRGQPIFGYRAYEDLYASVRDGPWKLFAYRSGRLSLYQVESDRYEQSDLSEVEPQITARLKAELIDWERKLGIQNYSGVQ